MTRLTQIKSKAKGVLLGGNSMCKGPEEGLLGKFKEGDRKQCGWKTAGVGESGER